MNKLVLLLGIFLIGILLFACAPRAMTTVPVEEKLAEVVAPAVKEDWEAKWEKTLEAAKKERRVVIYGSTPAVAIKAAISMFRNKYGIDLEVIFGRGGELRSKVGAERSGGLYIPDVYIAGASGLNINFSQGWVDPYPESILMLPKVVDPKVWYGGELPWLDKKKRGFIFLSYPTPNISINTELVNKGEIKSYYDLLNPKWKGKILMNDLTITGAGLSFFMNMVEHKVLDLDFFRKLIMEQKPSIHRDYRLMADWLSRGKYSIALAVAGGQIEQFREAGAPIDDITVKEGTYLSIDGSVTTLMNKRPHPNAAAIFINWLFSKEGQIHIQKILGYQSGRVDIGTEGVTAERTREPGIKYYGNVQSDIEWGEQHIDKYIALAVEIQMLSSK